MLFRRASVRYGRTPEPETPYHKAAQIWDERIGAARIQARNWRLTTGRIRKGSLRFKGAGKIFFARLGGRQKRKN